ncbi:MAG: alpha-amylase, partial [Nitrospinota bacterium]
LMVDLVLNHVSRQSEWFRDYVEGIAPARDYFITVDPQTDLSQVVRPRSTPLLTPVQTQEGSRYLWTTFSTDQIALNFANPDVLFEFLDILLLYISMGARIIRLDAIAYLWKKIGTPCIHLPETHEIVKLLRDFLTLVAPHVLLLTETNVPHAENISYFGNGDEAHLVYQFSLPPLLLHALQTGNSRYLTRWAASLPSLPTGCTVLNFTASHDGIGVRPLHGLIPEEEFSRLVEGIRQRGGYISMKRDTDGSESPYELNITYFDALSDPEDPDMDRQVARFLCSQAVMLALQGIPAIYFHSLTATPNDEAAVRRTGHARAINRKRWDAHSLEALLQDASTITARVFRSYLHLLRLRARHPAFHPEGVQRILDLGDSLFALERTAPDQSETIVALHNVTAHTVTVPIDRIPSLQKAGQGKELITGRTMKPVPRTLRLSPYATAWIRVSPPH